MKMDFGRRTVTKAALAIAGALTIAGAVGSALAISPSLQAPIKWQGGWEAVATAATNRLIYTVPSGRSLMVTDIIVGNPTGSAARFSLTTGALGTCNNLYATKIPDMPIAAGGVVHLPLQTGLGFGSGLIVCFNSTAEMNLSFRGFLFTSAPAS